MSQMPFTTSTAVANREDHVRDRLRPILDSRSFDRAETLKKLLIYLWEQRDSEISEYAIAIDALGRRTDFDPKLDATVRVQISRLRRKLREFYETEGINCSLKISIPIGSHMLQVAEVESQEVAAEEASVIESGNQNLLRILTAVCIVLTLFCGWLLWTRGDASGTRYGTKHGPIAFWNSFLSHGTKTEITLPTPIFFKFSGNKELRVRDLSTNDFQDWSSSVALKDFSNRFGPPALEQSYTVASDTFAAIALARSLDAMGLGDSVVFNNNANSSMSDLETSNEIALGAYATLGSFQFYLNRMNFRLTQGEAEIENRNPTGTEPKVFQSTTEGSGLTIEPGIIALLPGKSPNTRLMILQGRHTAALVTMLTSTTGADLITNIRKEKGNPPFYEVAILCEMNGDHMIRSWPVAFRARNAKDFGL